MEREREQIIMNGGGGQKDRVGRGKEDGDERIWEETDKIKSHLRGNMEI